ncbi:MAG: hypothetical protein FWB97_02330 [Oscillospiraceae bacterium]|nr:hypothetical protein [Oscillospiraceae bacterium]
MLNLSAINSTNAANYAETTSTAATGGTPAPGADFSAILTGVMQDNLMRTAQMPGGGGSHVGMPGGFMPMHDHGLEQALLAAASSGETTDAHMALFMLMMMMQSSSDGDFGMQMQMMAMVIQQMQAQADREAVRSSAMSADFHPYVLSSIDRNVFNGSPPATSGSGAAILPVDAWRPTTPAITSNMSNRSPELYRAVVDQFMVESAERYRPGRNGNTFCNIFVWDVTRAMGAEIPHYTDPVTGNPRFYPDIRGARPMGAIATCQWLQTHGERFGWREVDAKTAQMHANQGRPAITSAGSIGHVQMVVPSRDGMFDPVRGVSIAQAGRINSNYMPITGIYGANALANSVRYWIHD